MVTNVLKESAASILRVREMVSNSAADCMVSSQKTAVLIFGAVRTSNLTQF
jgi:hypothetical protein